MILKITSIILLAISLSACFDKEVMCDINGLAIDDSIIGMDRNMIINTLGSSNLSALTIKGFEDYIYEFNGKKYGISIYYEVQNGKYIVSDYKCTKVDPKIERFNHVLWH